MCHWHILAPRRGCFSNHLPLRRVRIFASSACFYGIGNSIGISYSIKKEAPQRFPKQSSHTWNGEPSGSSLPQYLQRAI